LKRAHMCTYTRSCFFWMGERAPFFPGGLAIKRYKLGTKREWVGGGQEKGVARCRKRSGMAGRLLKLSPGASAATPFPRDRRGAASWRERRRGASTTRHPRHIAPKRVRRRRLGMGVRKRLDARDAGAFPIDDPRPMTHWLPIELIG